MLGFKQFENAASTIAGVGLIHRMIRSRPAAHVRNSTRRLRGCISSRPRSFRVGPIFCGRSPRTSRPGRNRQCATMRTARSLATSTRWTAARSARVKITDILLEVDRWTTFSQMFAHLKTGEEHRDHTLLLTAILADAFNLGLLCISACAESQAGFWGKFRLACDSELRAADAASPNLSPSALFYL
jgi:hypothetical protein